MTIEKQIDKKDESQMKNNFILEGSIYKGLFFLAIPILISNILQGSYQFIDAYWIGKLSHEAVAASSASGTVYFLILSLGMGFSMAGTILIAQYAGAKNQKMLNKSASQTLSVDLFLAVLLGAVGFFNAEGILQLMNVEPAVRSLAVPFLQITFMGMIFSFIFSMFQSILRGVGEVKFPMYIVAFTVVLNMILDPMFIFGFGFIPAMGMSGAAWATMLVQAISAIIGVTVLFRRNYGVKVSLREMWPNFSFIKKVFFLGLPSSVEMSLRSFGMALMMTLVTTFGTVALAGFGAGGYIFQMIFFPVMGFSIATSTMIGQNIGARQLTRVDDIAKKSMILSAGVLSIVGLLVYIFAPFLVGLFIQDESESTRLAVDLLRINSWSFPFMAIQFGLTGAFRAAGNATLAMNLGLISVFVIQFPLAFLLSRTTLEVNGIWWAYAITNVAMTFICLGIFARGKWKHKNLTNDTKTEGDVARASKSAQIK